MNPNEFGLYMIILPHEARFCTIFGKIFKENEKSQPLWLTLNDLYFALNMDFQRKNPIFAYKTSYFQFGTLKYIDVYQYITTVLLPLCGKEITVDADNFFNAISNRIQNAQVVEQGNIYHGTDIDVEVATVHAVKGETHASTLYLETFYYGHHESERLSEQFKGVVYTGEDERILKNLRVAYVGMSRARYLLCVAIQKNRFDNMDCAELREIWDVVDA